MIHGCIKPEGQIEVDMFFSMSKNDAYKYIDNILSNPVEAHRILDEIVTKKFVEKFPKVYTFTPEHLIQEFSYNIHFDTYHGLMHLYRNEDDKDGAHFLIKSMVLSTPLCDNPNDYTDNEYTISIDFDRYLVYQRYIAISIDPDLIDKLGLENRLFFIADEAHAEYFCQMFTEDIYEVEYENEKDDHEGENIEDVLKEICEKAGWGQSLTDEENEEDND